MSNASSFSIRTVVVKPEIKLTKRRRQRLVCAANQGDSKVAELLESFGHRLKSTTWDYVNEHLEVEVYENTNNAG